MDLLSRRRNMMAQSRSSVNYEDVLRGLFNNTITDFLPEYFPSGVTRINGNCPIKLTYDKFSSIVIPDGFTSVDFSYIKTDYLYIPQSVSLGAFGLNGIQSLSIKLLEIGEGRTDLTAYALQSAGVSNVILPSSLTSVGGRALSFNKCNTLRIKATTPPIGLSDSFGNLNKTCKIYVPDQSVNAYKDVLTDRIEYIFPMSEFVDIE